MKKTVSLILCAAMFFAVCASFGSCFGQAEESTPNPELTVAQIARELYVSEAYLRRTFHEAYGESPKRCILRRRIDRAISLLETNYYTVAEVAEMSGFHDPRHFSTVFKKTVGRSPSDYRYDFKM